MTSFDGILGNDWFVANKATIDYPQNKIRTPQFSLKFDKTISPPTIRSLQLTDLTKLSEEQFSELKEPTVQFSELKEPTVVGFERSPMDKTVQMSGAVKPAQLGVELSDQNHTWARVNENCGNCVESEKCDSGFESGESAIR